MTDNANIETVQSIQDHLKNIHGYSKMATDLAVTVRDAMHEGIDYCSYKNVLDLLTEHNLRVQQHLEHLAKTLEGEAHAPKFDEDGFLWG